MGDRRHGGKVEGAERWAALTSRDGFRCYECPDEVRIARGCNRPLRDFPDYPEPRNVASCPVLDVPAWYWRAVDRLRRHESGLHLFDPHRETWQTMTLLETIQSVRDLRASRDAEARGRGFASVEDEERAQHNRAMLSRFVKRAEG